MNFIIVNALAVQCGCKVASPLGTCLDPMWLTHCLDNCHTINDSHLPWWQWNSVNSYILWLQITTSFVWQRLKYIHQLALVCAWYEFATHCEKKPVGGM